MNNLFALDGIPNDPALPEHFEQLLAGPSGLRVERIVSCGQQTPEGEWYDQNWDEWVLVLLGEALLGFADGKTQQLCRGDFLLLPSHTRHRVLHTSNPCIWLAIHAERLDDPATGRNRLMP